MERRFIWGGRIVSVTLPPESSAWSETERACFVQVRASGGDLRAAYRAVFALGLPGIGWTTTPAILPFSCAVRGLGPDDVSDEFGTSSPAATARTHSQRRPPHVPSHAEKHAVSDSGGPRKHSLPRATSSASRPRDPPPAAANRPPPSRAPRPAAKPRRAGWMGSAPTTA
jgi:hypothetical protein